MAARSQASPQRNRASHNPSIHGDNRLDCHPSSCDFQFQNCIKRGNDTSTMGRPETSPTLTQQRTTTHAIGSALGCTSALSTRTHGPSGGK